MMNKYGLLTIVAIALIAGVSDALPPQAIVGGQRAAVGEFPYQVSLRKKGQHSCGGAIISSRHVITAKHCVDSFEHPYNDLRVATGSIVSSGGQLHAAKSIHYYVKRMPNDYRVSHDIAIIELNETIALNNSTQKIVELSTELRHDSFTAIATGWGYLSDDSLFSSYYLMKLSVTMVGYQSIGNLFRARGPSGTGICHGDSGGPLVRNGRLIGIAVAIYGGCANGFPDEYINTFYYNYWIRQVIETN